MGRNRFKKKRLRKRWDYTERSIQIGLSAWQDAKLGYVIPTSYYQYKLEEGLNERTCKDKPCNGIS